MVSCRSLNIYLLSCLVKLMAKGILLLSVLWRSSFPLPGSVLDCYLQKCSLCLYLKRDFGIIFMDSVSGQWPCNLLFTRRIIVLPTLQPLLFLQDFIWVFSSPWLSMNSWSQHTFIRWCLQLKVRELGTFQYLWYILCCKTPTSVRNGKVSEHGGILLSSCFLCQLLP